MGESLGFAGNIPGSQKVTFKHKLKRVMLDDHTACRSPEEDADLQ